MHIKILTAVLMGLLTLTAGCGAGQLSKLPKDETDIVVNYPPQSALKFPEEQTIRKQFLVTAEWQTITFEKPLMINREGLRKNKGESPERESHPC